MKLLTVKVSPESSSYRFYRWHSKKWLWPSKSHSKAYSWRIKQVTHGWPFIGTSVTNWNFIPLHSKYHQIPCCRLSNPAIFVNITIILIKYEQHSLQKEFGCLGTASGVLIQSVLFFEFVSYFPTRCSIYVDVSKMVQDFQIIAI